MGARFTHTLATLSTGATTEVTPDLDASALWLSPGSDVSAQASPGAPDRVFKALESVNAAAPNQPFGYLSYLGARTPGAGWFSSAPPPAADHRRRSAAVGALDRVGR